MTTIPDFAHHTIPLLPASGQQGALGGKAHLAAVKEACKIAEQINRSLALVCRSEIAVVPPCADFFGNDPSLVKVRKLAWETIRKTSNIYWTILAQEPETIVKSLPADWIGKGYKNVCFGIVADGAGDWPGKLHTLRKTSAHHRMVLIAPFRPQIDLGGKIEGIDWVVSFCNSDDDPHVDPIKESCRQAKVAFLFHRLDNERRTCIPGGDAASEIVGEISDWPDQPFGPKVQLHRPTLPELKSMSAAIAALSAPPAEVEVETDTSSMPGQPTELPPVAESAAPSKEMLFEVIPARASGDAETFACANETSVLCHEDTPITETDRADFSRFDQLVRKNLQSFIAAGNALLAIRQRDLWRAGGHTSWAAYCLSVGGLTKTHANRLINGSEIVERLTQVAPTGVTPLGPLPNSEWQVRPLCRLKDPEQQAAAWSRALESAGGGQPTAKLISDIVADLMAGEHSPADTKTTRKQVLVDAFGRLRAAVLAKKPAKQIESVITELEKLLRLV